MDLFPPRATPQELAHYLLKNFDNWQALMDCILIHKEHSRGPGVIKEVSPRSLQQVLLRVIHRDDNATLTERKYMVNSGTLSDYFPQMVITPELERQLAIIREEIREEIREDNERKAQAERERAPELNARKEFADRKVKYGAENYADTSPLSRLNSILMHLEESKPPSVDDIEWLSGEKLYTTLALYREGAFRVTGFSTHLTAACSAWRKAGEPEKALALTDTLLAMPEATDRYFRAPILTTRGGALRDMEKLKEAEECAWEAIHCNETYYPHNLLGAIFFQFGQAEKGDRHFSRAIELGSAPPAEKTQMEGALKRSGIEERRVVAEYLLRKDPERYAWVKRYLPPASNTRTPLANH